MSTFTVGGNAVDAAIAANAVLAVTAPHLCGMGGDLFALVRTPDGEVVGLNASGRAGSGADAEALRAERLAAMPLRHDVRTVTVPGCVDGWIAAARPLRAPRPGHRPRAGDPARRVRVPGQPAARRLAVGCSTTPAGSSSTSSPTRRPRRAPRSAARASPSTLQAHRRRRPRRRSTAGRSARVCSPSATGCSPPTTSPTEQAEWVEPLTRARVRRRAGHDPAELAGLPDARHGPAGRRGRAARRSGRPGVGAPADRGGHRRLLRPTRRAPRGRRRRRARRRRSTAGSRPRSTPSAPAGVPRPPSPATRPTSAPPTVEGWR